MIITNAQREKYVPIRAWMPVNPAHKVVMELEPKGRHA